MLHSAAKWRNAVSLNETEREGSERALMKRNTIYMALLLSLTLILAACVSSTGDTTTSSGDQGATTTQAEQSTTTAAEAATPTAGGAATTTVAAAGPVMIGAIHPLTGGLAGAGNRMDNGARMAVEEINAAGGIASLGGVQLELVSADSTGAPDVGQSEAARLIDDGVSAIIGTYQS